MFLEKHSTKGWLKRGGLVSLALLLLLSSCSWNKENKNVLILSLENFPAGSINCVNNENKTEIDELICQEFVRFSHAYTPSTLAQPALASILTGLYPFQHNVWNNGTSFLSEKHWTVAELAKDRSYSTSFFSGGGSIWRKSGFYQGFEIFDEHGFYKNQRAYRDANKLGKYFEKWLGSIGNNDFFSVLHYADLLFPTVVTVDDFGVERSLSKLSQLSEWKESIGSLFRSLKKKKKWDNTMVIIVGLNGVTPIDRNSEFSPLDLHSENTQVGLFIKPQRKKRDRGLAWTIDVNISLVDLGASLFDFFGQKLKSTNSLKGKSLLPLLENKSEGWKSERPILIESGWGQWKKLSNTRSALVLGKKFFFYQDPIIYYNTLIDQKESIPIQWKDSIPENEQSYILDILQKAGLDIWSGVDYFEVRRLKLGQILWRDGLDKYLYDELRILSGKLNNSKEIGDWLAYHSLKERNWKRLSSLGKSYGIGDFSYVSANNLERKFQSKNLSRCFAYLVKVDSKRIIKRGERDLECKNKMVESLYQWKHGPRAKREYWRENFIQQYKTFVKKRHFAKLNFVSGMVWDISDRLKISLSPAELYLMLPSNGFHRKLTAKRVSYSPLAN